MATRHFDVVVVGRSIGALAAAALLARRDFRVLLFGQGQRPATYQFEGLVFARRPFTLLAGMSPVWRKLLHELAQSPRFRRRVEPLDPMFCLLDGKRRVEVAPDMEAFSREVDREYPEVRQLVEELYGAFADANGAVDDAFEKDVVWPPQSFMERLETRRVTSGMPYISGESPQDLLGKFPAEHPFRTLALVPAVFGSDLWGPASQMPGFALARLHGAWTRGVWGLSRGEDELSEFLAERITAHGGSCLLDRRIGSIEISRDRAVGVLEADEEEPISADQIVFDQPGEWVADLSRGRGITKQARKDWPRVLAGGGRFVTNFVVNKEAIPEPLGVESFIVPERHTDPRRPTLHVQRINPRAYTTDADENHVLLCTQLLLPRRGPLTLLEARQAALDVMSEHFPFLRDHLVAVDSPHDGLPLHRYVEGKKREIERIHVAETATDAEPMQPLWTVDPPGYLDLAAEPVRGPVRGTYLVGSTVLPALGQEGQLLAAFSAARLITRKDRARQKIRRQMWSKIETG